MVFDIHNFGSTLAESNNGSKVLYGVTCYSRDISVGRVDDCSAN